MCTCPGAAGKDAVGIPDPCSTGLNPAETGSKVGSLIWENTSAQEIMGEEKEESFAQGGAQGPKPIWAKEGPLAPMYLRDPKWLRAASRPGQLGRGLVEKGVVAWGSGATSPRTTPPGHQGSEMGTLLWPQRLSLPTSQVFFIGPRWHLRSLSTKQESTQANFPSFPVLKWWREGR